MLQDQGASDERWIQELEVISLMRHKECGSVITSTCHRDKVRETPTEGPFLLPEISTPGYLGIVDSVPSDKTSQS